MSKLPISLAEIVASNVEDKRRPRKQERTVYDGNVKRQFPPYFEVQSKGTMIEYTSDRGEAYSAFFMASLPREVIRIDVVAGRAFRTVVERTSDIQHRKVA